MIKVGKIYKLASKGFSNVDINDPITFKETSVPIKDCLFLILEINIKIKELCRKYPDTEIFKILFNGKIYYFPIYKEYLDVKKESFYLIKFIEVV